MERPQLVAAVAEELGAGLLPPEVIEDEHCFKMYMEKKFEYSMERKFEAETAGREKAEQAMMAMSLELDKEKEAKVLMKEELQETIRT